MECEYCHKILSSKYSLKTHQKTAKYCLALRGKKNDGQEYACSTCTKTFLNKSSLESHAKICKAKIQKESDNYISEITDMLEKTQEQLEEYKMRCIKAEADVQRLTNEIEFLRGIAKDASNKPTNVTNKTTNIQNIVNNLAIFDKTQEDIDRIFQERFDRNYLVDGQKGVAQFTKIHVLEQGQGKPKVYLITDRSRCKAMYKNGDGELCTDYGMQGLTRKIHPSAKKKSMQIVQEHAGTEYYPILSERCTEILEMTYSNTKFCKEMVVNDIPNAS
jgi:predicted RNase H-like nuclease (RuvC/YqgF family)